MHLNLSLFEFYFGETICGGLEYDYFIYTKIRSIVNNLGLSKIIDNKYKLKH